MTAIFLTIAWVFFDQFGSMAYGSPQGCFEQVSRQRAVARQLMERFDLNDPELEAAVPHNYAHYADIEGSLSKEAQACFAGGSCQPEAVATITGDSFEVVAERLAKAAQSTGGPIRRNLDNYLYNHPRFRGQPHHLIQDRSEIRRLVRQAMEDHEGKNAYIILMPGHVESIFQGKLSFPMRYADPGGRKNRPLIDRILETLRHEGDVELIVIPTNPGTL